jgi:dynein heavy chain 1
LLLIESSPRFTFSYAIKSEITYSNSLVASLVLIKRQSILEAARPLQSQLQFINLPGPASEDESDATAATPLPTSPTMESADEAGMPNNVGTTTTMVSPYEALHAYIHFAVSPYFNAYVSSKSKQELVTNSGASKRDPEKDARMGIPMAKKKFAELELSLLHLQQNVEIPEINLLIHPVVQRVVDKVMCLLYLYIYMVYHIPCY